MISATHLLGAAANSCGSARTRIRWGRAFRWEGASRRSRHSGGDLSGRDRCGSCHTCQGFELGKSEQVGLVFVRVRQRRRNLTRQWSGLLSR